jgi:D-methionine transport system substrate-binding protein
MKKNLVTIIIALAGGIAALGGCSQSNDKTITICASELPHAKILNEAFAPLLTADGYTLKVTVLDWTLQNEALSAGDYDANYFQHVPYLETYTGSVALSAACKIHYEKLCLYVSSKDTDEKLDDGESIELVNDVTNVERALAFLQSYGYLTIKDSDYVDGSFTNFDVTSPNDYVTWADGYTNCTLTCVQESSLCASLPDYNFGIIPGNTAMTGLGNDYASQIVLSESATDETIAAKANIIAVKTSDIASAKTKELVKVAADASVASYISSTFGDSVLYHYEDLTSSDVTAGGASSSASAS